MIDWNKTTKEEMESIRCVCARAVKTFPDLDKLTLNMDISAAHIKQPLNLKKLEGFNDLNFFHDIFGIRRHINRVTGDLMNCFLPRCSV